MRYEVVSSIWWKGKHVLSGKIIRALPDEAAPLIESGAVRELDGDEAAKVKATAKGSKK